MARAGLPASKMDRVLLLRDISIVKNPVRRCYLEAFYYQAGSKADARALETAAMNCWLSSLPLDGP